MNIIERLRNAPPNVLLQRDAANVIDSLRQTLFWIAHAEMDAEGRAPSSDVLRDHARKALERLEH